MITAVNKNNANQYDAIFDEVSNNINICGKGKEGINLIKEEDQIKWKNLYDTLNNDSYEYKKYYIPERSDEVSVSSLQLYFGILQNLVQINDKYGILPLDEPCFEINANTRAINIPKNFSVQVQGDNLAETIYFRIARYFDTTDLYNQKIAIRYELPNGSKRIAEPWTSIIDENTGDIIFGWPLGEEATAYTGTLKFAVQFYYINNENVKEYSFNTLAADLNIKKGINIDDNSQFEEDDNNRQTILDRFKNGYIPGMIKINTPEIGYANLNDDRYYFIPKDNVYYNLFATAISPEAGAISYSWYCSETKGGKSNLVSADNQSIIYASCSLENGEITSVQYEGIDLTTDLEVDELSTEKFIDTYECYYETEANVLTRITSASQLENLDEFKLLLSQCMATAPGYYYCVVSNQVGLQSEKIYTDNAHFPYPEIPTPYEEGFIREGLAEGDTIQLDIPETTINSSIPGLADASDICYSWEKVNNFEDEAGEVLSENSLTQNISNLGKYRCKAYSKLNNCESDGVYKYWTVEGPSNVEVLINNVPTVNQEYNYVKGTVLQFKINNSDKFDSITYLIEPEEGKGAPAISQEITNNKTNFEANFVVEYPIRYTITITGNTGIHNKVSGTPAIIIINGQVQEV